MWLVLLSLMKASVMLLQRSLTGCVSVSMLMLGFYWTSWTVPI